MDSRFGKTLRVALLLPIISFSGAKAQTASEVVYKSAAEVTNWPPIGDKTATVVSIPTGPVTVLSARRVGKGDAEVHMKRGHFFVATGGKADVILGTKIEGDRETGPNERLGGNVVGGRVQTMSSGDILWIPPLMGHQVIVPQGGSFSYLVFNYAEDPTAKK